MIPGNDERDELIGRGDARNREGEREKRISRDAAVADKFAGSLISFYRRDTLAKAPALYTNGAALS